MLIYQWLEDSLKQGEKASEDLYHLDFKLEGESNKAKSFSRESDDRNASSDDEQSPQKEARSSFDSQADGVVDTEKGAENKKYDSPRSCDSSLLSSGPANYTKQGRKIYSPFSCNTDS